MIRPIFTPDTEVSGCQKDKPTEGVQKTGMRLSPLEWTCRFGSQRLESLAEHTGILHIR